MFRHTRAKLVLQCHQVSKPLIDLDQEIGPGPFNILIPEFDDHLGESANRSYRVDRVGFASCIGITAHRPWSFPSGSGAPSQNLQEFLFSRDTGTPNSRARSALLPASSPANTTLVFRDTEPATLAPDRRNAASASGRVISCESPRDYDALASERAACGAITSIVVDCPHACSPNLFEDGKIFRRVEKIEDSLRLDKTNAGHTIDGFNIGGNKIVERVKAVRQEAGRSLANKRNTKSENQPFQWTLLACLHSSAQITCTCLAQVPRVGRWRPNRAYRCHPGRGSCRDRRTGPPVFHRVPRCPLRPERQSDEHAA